MTTLPLRTRTVIRVTHLLALLKGEQLSMFGGGPPSAPPARPAGGPHAGLVPRRVNVPTHTRDGHTIVAHQTTVYVRPEDAAASPEAPLRHVDPVPPVAAPVMDDKPRISTRDAIGLTRPEIAAAQAKHADHEPTMRALQAELDRRGQGKAKAAAPARLPAPAPAPAGAAMTANDARRLSYREIVNAAGEANAKGDAATMDLLRAEVERRGRPLPPVLEPAEAAAPVVESELDATTEAYDAAMSPHVIPDDPINDGVLACTEADEQPPVSDSPPPEENAWTDTMPLDTPADVRAFYERRRIAGDTDEEAAAKVRARLDETLADMEDASGEGRVSRDTIDDQKELIGWWGDYLDEHKASSLIGYLSTPDALKRIANSNDVNGLTRVAEGWDTGSASVVAAAQARLDELRMARGAQPLPSSELMHEAEDVARAVAAAEEPAATPEPEELEPAARQPVGGDEDDAPEVEPAARAPRGPRAPAAGVEDDGIDERDAGQVIPDARKHAFAMHNLTDLTNAEAAGVSEHRIAAAVTKAKLFEKPNAALAKATGMEPGAHAMVAELLARVGAKPHTPANASPQLRADLRRGYLTMAEWLPKQLAGCRTADDVHAFMVGAGHTAFGRNPLPPMTHDEVIKAIEGRLGRKLQEFGTGYGYGSSHYLYPRHRRGMSDAKVEPTKITEGDMRAAGFHTIESMNDDATGLPRYMLIERQDPALAARFAPAFASMGKRFVDTVSNRSKRYDVEKVGRDVARDADPWAKAGLTADATGADGAGEEPTGAAKRARLTWATHPGGAKYVREGGPPVPDNVTPDQFIQSFGFRGAQFGHYVNDADALGHVARAHGAFTDLADVLGFDPKHMSHGGMLGMAFGARGKGGNAAAHYEADDLAINITHTQGAGSLAHEWGHFMDHVLSGYARPQQVDYHGATVTKNREEWATNGDRLRAHFLSHGEGHKNVHPEVAEAIVDVMNAINGKVGANEARARDLFRQAEKAQAAGDTKGARELMRQWGEVSRSVAETKAKNRKVHGTTLSFLESAQLMGDYWHRPHELFARAWESYVEDKLHANGRKNTYLVHGTADETPTEVVVKTDWAGRMKGKASGKDLEDAKVKKATVYITRYPAGEERTTMYAAFDRLTSALRRSNDLVKAMQALALARAGVRPKARTRFVVRVRA